MSKNTLLGPIVNRIPGPILKFVFTNVDLLDRVINMREVSL